MGESRVEPYQLSTRNRFDSVADVYADPSWSRLLYENRSGGSLSLEIIKAEHEPLDLPSAGASDIVFVRDESAVADFLLDFGDGARRITTAKGEFTILPADTQFRLAVDVQHAMTTITLPLGRVTRIFEEVGVPHNSLVGRFRTNISKPLASSLMNRIWSLTESNIAYNALMLDGLTLQFLSLMADEDALSPFGSSSKEDVRVARAVDYIHASLADKISIEDLASVAAISPSHFARTFKATTGKTPWSYVQQARLDRARHLLGETRTPIARVAAECGFSSQSHLTNAFRQAFGATPGYVRSVHAGDAGDDR